MKKGKKKYNKKESRVYSATGENCGECWAAPKITSKLG
jgi:formamidopyrimidine-DNA glycosylase